MLATGPVQAGLPENAVENRARHQDVAGAGHLDFDIPAGSLEDALRIYGENTGVAVLVDGGLVAHRRASPVRGRYSATQALAKLLVGTGLLPRYVGRDAFTLVVDTRQEARSSIAMAEVPIPIMSSAEQMVYAANLQAAVGRVLCGSRVTSPGDYRAVIRIWLDGGSRVVQARLLQTTGIAERDAAIGARLVGEKMGGIPPGIPQPLVVLMLPNDGNMSSPCDKRPG